MGASKSIFIDIPSDDPYYLYIDAIAENNITTGYSDETYRPEQSVDRMIKYNYQASYYEAYQLLKSMAYQSGISPLE